ncbi:MAG TPA: S8 family serine peptidase [Polyangiales bacterium]|nr:S8 family serine peptidase [Polyangiales bacterium]
MDTKTRWVGLGVLGFLVLFQVSPCDEDLGDCGPAIHSDGVQSCEDWSEDYVLDPGDSDVTVSQVEVKNFLEELSSFGASMPAARATASEEPTPATQAESIERVQAYVLEYAENRATDEPIEVVLDMGDLPFPELPQLQAMDAASRDRVLADRKALIEREQQGIKAYLDQLGARTTKPVGLLNHLQAWIAPDAIADVAAHPDVKAIHPAWQPIILLYDQEEVRKATFLSEYWDQEIKGESKSRICEPAAGYEDIKIAVVEASISSFVLNRLNRVHPGWGDCVFGSCESRVRAELNCSFVSEDLDACLPWTGDLQTLANHGTWVTSIAAGDLTQGQDPRTTDPDEQRRRTGIAPEASILYLNASSTGFVAAAVATAFLLGADVINLSLAVTECAFDLTDLTADCGGLNQVIRTVTKGGALVVAAAGNENSEQGRCEPTSGCSVCYPAVRPEVLAVGNVETSQGIDYDLAEIAENSSRGFARVGVGGQHSADYPSGVDIPVVSIAAPGNLCAYFNNDDTYDEVGRSGTSFSAPVISAAAGLVREEFGPAVWDARMLKSHVLTMGDGSGADVSQPGVAVGTSSVWGTGRVKMHPFDAMQSPKGLAHRSFRIHENERVLFHAADTKGDALEPDVTQWKMGMYIDWPDLSTIPYLLISYWNTCNRPRLIAADLNPGLERHVVLESPAIDQACLEIRVYGYSVPAGGVEVFVTDYYHSGDPSEH